MGCDIFWNGRQPDEATQDECARFLVCIAKERGWEYDSFDGSLPGPVLSADHCEHYAEPVDISADARQDFASDRLDRYVDYLSVRGLVLYPEGCYRQTEHPGNNDH